MRKFRGFNAIAAPALVALAAAGLGSGCSDNGLSDPSACGAQIQAKAEAFSVAVDALVEVSGKMKAELAVACYKIASDLGDTTVTDPGTGADVSDDELTALCNAASAKITAEIQASGSISIAVEGGKCTVDASAQFSCEANCDVSGQCTAGDINARCTPGELSVQCSGECAAGATCEGSATVAANCEGTCEATCTGTCSGTCNGECSAGCSATNADGSCAGTCSGTCTGKCDAQCSGTCTGECKLAADANISCGAEARCKGECTGTATAPECRVSIEPPECNLDADCQAGCEGQAQFKAACTPPKIVITGEGSATLVTTLEANLPAVYKVIGQAEVVAKAAGKVAGKAVAVAEAVLDSTGCALKFGGTFMAKMQASVEASASVSVSVEASAEVGGSTGG